MSLKKYVSKVSSMLSTLDNPRFFIYRCFHYINRYMPVSAAKSMAKKNARAYAKQGFRELRVSTYDGSDQSVHPDITRWKDQYYLAVTPYPYGMEEYENPCVYRSADMEAFIPVGAQPLAFPKKHHYGCHLSDPCILVFQDRLACFYRESERITGGEISTVWMTQYDESTDSWGAPKEVISSTEDLLLSPAMVVSAEGNCSVFHVNSAGELQLSELDGDCRMCNSRTVSCEDLPEGYAPWHIAVVYKETMDKQQSNSEELLGLFLLRSATACQNPFRLYLASSEGLGKPWKMEREICWSDEIQQSMMHPYKSCFIPGTQRLLLSFRDARDRYRLTVLSDL